MIINTHPFSYLLKRVQHERNVIEAGSCYDTNGSPCYIVRGFNELEPGVVHACAFKDEGDVPLEQKVRLAWNSVCHALGIDYEFAKASNPTTFLFVEWKADVHEQLIREAVKRGIAVRDTSEPKGYRIVGKVTEDDSTG